MNAKSLIMAAVWFAILGLIVVYAIRFGGKAAGKAGAAI